MVREKDIENRLRVEIEKLGGVCWKFVSSVSGVPDRICLLPERRIVFVELKAPGAKPRPIQKYIHNKMKRLGFPVVVIDSFEGVDQLIGEMERRPE